MYQNYSRMGIPLKMPEATAKSLAKAMPVSILLVLRFLGAGLHKNCQKNCMRILGETVCGYDNWGMGIYYEAELVGYEVVVDGKIVAEKQPA